MPQTMLAFLALMMITVSSLNYFEGQQRTHDNMIRSEYEIMANAATIEAMEIIGQGTDWDDLDELDGDSTSVSYTVGAFSVPFSMETAVQYVNADGTPSATPTAYKEVALTSSNTRFAVALVTHARIFAE